MRFLSKYIKKPLQDFLKPWIKDFHELELARLFWLGAGFVTLAIILWKFGHYFEARLGITLAVVEIPIFVFGASLARKLLREASEEAKEAKKLQDKDIHTQQLTDNIYKKLLRIHLNSVDDKVELQIERFDMWEEWQNKLPPASLWMSIEQLPYPYFGYAIDHLKEYREIYIPWNAMKSLTDMINKGLKPKEVEMTKGFIQQSIEKFRAELSKLIARLEAREPLKGICSLGL